MIVELVHIQGVFQRHNIADGFLFIRLFFIAHQVGNHQAGEYANDDNYHHNFQ
ncbi:Uncharacterised protein [Escherichia coli]|uniref:Uncharacterized protein n=1 Tax=Klebsiella pneumoniae TaxID=573 RepID=A0ABD7NZY4_KLEPN|nr:Uncharacterised protein [Escherichia coli]CAD5571040.1 Uncharacterised protein [Escherichia coli]SVS30735.1 Uncharacterised protein [Klebsiella pneumoniae]